ncbi:Arylphorin subunit alpha [Papilio xuthus]|uniref:Arylphorin subunit alpha n=1 Tax=Papilio xuthus TaxID=66420 RepID=A0A194PW98_PAPXU|nr:Arylphorin subunit alpha [Papilio xuthus]
MKTLLVLAGLVALAMSGAVPTETVHFKTKTVDAEFVTKQKKIFELFFTPAEISKDAEYYKIAKEWNIEANIENYTNKKAVEDFLVLYKHGFLPRNHVFSIFYEKQRDEAIALFHLFYYAKDFDTFYKTAAYARVFLNEGQFLYAYYIAIIHRPDTKGIVLPAPYELYPEFFVNTDVLYRIYRTKMQGGISNPDFASEYGITFENNYYVYNTNYSNYWTYGDEEYKLSYFTEDIGLNSYYYYFHSYFPFWLEGDFFTIWKDRRGEAYFYFYKQLIARYYLERLSNGLGEIPEFSWTKPIKTGYVPFLMYYYPFVQRPAHYQIPYETNVQELQFLDAYEKTFLQYLERGRFKAYNQEVDFTNSKSVNFVGNYWQSNVDLYEKFGPRNYHRSYEVTARRLLGASPEPADKYSYIPTALDFYQTSLRDPVFYQLYSRILKYFIQYKEYLTPYTQDLLHYVGVKVTDVKVDKLVTFFEYFDYDVTNSVFFTPEQLKTEKFTPYKVRQPRINHKPFTVTVDIKSEVEGDAVVKVFLGPKYNGEGFPLTLEDNWMNFIELDWFVHKLTAGQNKIERSSTDFLFYKEDSVPTAEIWKLLEQSKVPTHMSTEADFMPSRLMLPKGTKGGFPYQLFVVVYPYHGKEQITEPLESFIVDNKPFGYPLDRPVNEPYFIQPNMYFKDVFVYHEDEIYPYQSNYPYYVGPKTTYTKF